MNPLEQRSPAELRRRTSTKWTWYDADVLPLWVAEMDVDPAPPVREALERALRDGDTGYPGRDRYAEAFAGFAQRRWGWGPDPGATALVADVMSGLMEAIRLVSEPGDPVVVNPPVYRPFHGFLEAAGRRVVDVPLARGRLDLDALAEAFARERPAAYLLCSPHNPTGTVHTPAELTRVAELAEQHDVRVVVDEIHAPLVLAGATFTPYLSLSAAARGFAVTSASKSWNLAGAKAALLVAGPAALADLERLPWTVAHGPSHLGVIAHTAALEDGGPWLDELLAALDEQRSHLGDLLATELAAASWMPPEGTYLAWLDCSGLGLGDEPADRFLAEGRVAVNPGTEFGAGGAGHVRLNFATSREILADAVRRMASVR